MEGLQRDTFEAGVFRQREYRSVNNRVNVDATQIVDSPATRDNVEDAASNRAKLLSQILLTVLDDVRCLRRLFSAGVATAGGNAVMTAVPEATEHPL